MRFKDIKARLEAHYLPPPPDRKEEGQVGDANLRKLADRLHEERLASPPPPPVNVIGRIIGSYQIERELGHGGMGVVYLASRADAQFQKLVAIKLIRPGAMGDQVLARFRAERQILANLDHPNIARLIDGGVTDEGKPYLVMEYVQGARPIDSYCDEHRLSIRERLYLFRQVCEAVQYAHRFLVVHRDLKPGNILISADGAVKLMDFGVAKNLLAGFVTAPALPTLGTQLITPAYASPEQVRGEQIGTTSDVYSLGVVLYELLSGFHPFGSDERPLHELLHAICEAEPERPSAVTHRSAKKAAAGAAASAGIPEILTARREHRTRALRRTLRGDLDWIVLKAMRKDPQRRYASVEQFSEDIRRHLEGFPVVARPDTVRYRFSKFVQRNKAGVAGGAVILVAMWAFGFWIALRAQRSANERDAAVEMSYFLEKLVGATGGGYSQEVLERDAAQVLRRLEGKPEMQAEMLETIGEAYEKLGKLDQALPLLERALSIRRATFPAGHWLIAEAESALGGCLAAEGRFTEAEPLLVHSHPILAGRPLTSETRRALQRAPAMYELWGKPEMAARYR